MLLLSFQFLSPHLPCLEPALLRVCLEDDEHHDQSHRNETSTLTLDKELLQLVEDVPEYVQPLPPYVQAVWAYENLGVSLSAKAVWGAKAKEECVVVACSGVAPADCRSSHQNSKRHARQSYLEGGFLCRRSRLPLLSLCRGSDVPLRELAPPVPLPSLAAACDAPLLLPASHPRLLPASRQLLPLSHLSPFLLLFSCYPLL